jgi:hypothetical protein
VPYSSKIKYALSASYCVEAGRRKFLALAFVAFLVLPIVLSQRAFADGLFQENLPPAKIGERQASLFIKINPPILTSDTKQDAYVQLRLFDQRNNETIKFTTFIVSITKGTDPKAQPLLRDAFLTESGLLTLKIQPQEGKLVVAGTQDANLNAWMADPGGTVNIRGPILLEGGLYHFRIELLTIDNIHFLFNAGDSPVYETYLSVGDVTTQDVQFEGKTYPTTIISYYDKVKDFSFDANTKTYSWTMPFDWDVKRIQAAANVFVHEEIKVPKSFAGVGDVTAYDATVNGKPITGRMLAIDPFSSETEQILHFLINKNDILEMAKSVPAGSAEMTFSFAPSSETGEKTSGEIATDTGGVHVRLNWNPDQMSAGKEETVGLQFIDAFAGSNINADVTYDMKVVDSKGKEVFTAKDQIAKGGAGEQKMTFPADENYNVEVSVKSIQKEGQTADTTRNGIARGIVVVPEFPAGAAIAAAAGILGAVIAANRLVRRQK